MNEEIFLILPFPAAGSTYTNFECNPAPPKGGE